MSGRCEGCGRRLAKRAKGRGRQRTLCPACVKARRAAYQREYYRRNPGYRAEKQHRRYVEYHTHKARNVVETGDDETTE